MQSQCQDRLLSLASSSKGTSTMSAWLQETKQAVKGVRAAKARESQLRQTGVRPSVARKEALSAGRNGKKLKPKQRTK